MRNLSNQTLTNNILNNKILEDKEYYIINEKYLDFYFKDMQKLSNKSNQFKDIILQSLLTSSKDDLFMFRCSPIFTGFILFITLLNSHFIIFIGFLKFAWYILFTTLILNVYFLIQKPNK